MTFLISFSLKARHSIASARPVQTVLKSSLQMRLTQRDALLAGCSTQKQQGPAVPTPDTQTLHTRPNPTLTDRGGRARLARGAVRQQRRPQRHQRKALAQRHALQVHHARLHRSERLPPASAPPVRRGAATSDVLPRSAADALQGRLHADYFACRTGRRLRPLCGWGASVRLPRWFACAPGLHRPTLHAGGALRGSPARARLPENLERERLGGHVVGVVPEQAAGHEPHRVQLIVLPLDPLRAPSRRLGDRVRRSRCAAAGARGVARTRAPVARPTAPSSQAALQPSARSAERRT